MMSRVLATVALLLPLALACSNPQRPTTPTPLPGDPSNPPSDPYVPLPPNGGPTSISGVYQLTITASPSCSLPSEVRQRTYTVKIEEATRGYVTVTATAGSFALSEPPADPAGFEGTRDGDKMRFLIYNGYGGPYFIERIDETRNLFFEGVADVTIADDRIFGTLDAEIRYYIVGQQPELGQCTAKDHAIVFTR